MAEIDIASQGLCKKVMKTSLGTKQVSGMFSLPPVPLAKFWTHSYYVYRYMYTQNIWYVFGLLATIIRFRPPPQSADRILCPLPPVPENIMVYAFLLVFAQTTEKDNSVCEPNYGNPILIGRSHIFVTCIWYGLAKACAGQMESTSGLKHSHWQTTCNRRRPGRLQWIWWLASWSWKTVLVLTLHPGTIKSLIKIVRNWQGTQITSENI